jgi:hypothetical protein
MNTTNIRLTEGQMWVRQGQFRGHERGILHDQLLPPSQSLPWLQFCIKSKYIGEIRQWQLSHLVINLQYLSVIIDKVTVADHWKLRTFLHRQYPYRIHCDILDALKPEMNTNYFFVQYHHMSI